MDNTINAYGTSGVSSVSNTSSSLNSGSIQFIYAQLQMELAQSNKQAALDKIDGIRESQAESARLTEAINNLRNCKQYIGDKDSDYLKIGGVPANASNEQLEAAKTEDAQGNDKARQMYFDAAQVCNDYGIDYADNKITKADIDTMIASLEAAQEEMGSDIQQEMVFIQDYMGQYNSYTQGASSAISQASETLKTVARG